MSNAELVRAAAAAERLKLVTSATNVTGFKYVYYRSGSYVAVITENGTERDQRYLGTFATPEEAALCIASYMGVERAERAAAEAGEPLTVDEAWAAAAAEGLKLETSTKSGTGFKYVYKAEGGRYKVVKWDKSTSTQRYLNTFTTPGEAALWLAKKNNGSAACGDADDEEGDEKKQRFVWSKEVHQSFCKVVHALGIDTAKPQKIAEELARLAPDATELPTRLQIKSHLRWYRLLLAKQGDEGDTLGLGLGVFETKSGMFE